MTGRGETIWENIMTEKEFQDLCKTTEAGTNLIFIYGDQEVQVRFLGCGADEILVEANGKNFVWPRELCSFKRLKYQPPTYS